MSKVVFGSENGKTSMEDKIGIYKIISPTGKIYIGQSKNIYFRWDNHYQKLRCEEQYKLYNSLKKYGPENHKFEIVEECSVGLLNEKELIWGLFHDVLNPKKGLNLQGLGLQKTRSKTSIERTAKKIRKNILQYDLQGNFIKEWKGAPEIIKFLGKGNSNNINDCCRGKYIQTYGFVWIYRKKHERISLKIQIREEKKKGCSWTEERRIKTKNSRIGEKRSKEFSETMRKISTGNTKRLDKGLKPVIQLSIDGSFINEYKSVNEAKINIAGSTLKGSRIVECLKGKFPTAYGFKWEYK
jgi:group I intron endonuclease